MKHRIFITNTQTEKTPFRGYKSAVRNAIAKVLEVEGFSSRAEVSVTLVSREEIRELNRTWRGVDRSTDVLSFPLEEDESYGNTVCLGDVIVCPAVIAAQAEEFGTTYRQEFCLMVIHSALHLLGWDHIEETEKKEMYEKQERILRLLAEGEVKTEG